MTPDQRRRLQAKCVNESTKLTGTLLNNMAVGLFVGGLVAPLAASRDMGLAWYVTIPMAALALHLTGRLVIRSLISEE